MQSRSLLVMQLVRSALQRTAMRQLVPRSLLGCTCSVQFQSRTPPRISIRHSSHSRASDDSDAAEHAPLEEALLKPALAASPSIEGNRARPLIVFDLPGALPYGTVWKWQQRIVRDKVAAERRMKKAAAADSQVALSAAPSALDLSSGVSDVLLIVEHDAIYTLGRNSSLEHLRFPSDVTVRVAERGELSQKDAAAAETAKPQASAASRADFELLRVERGGEVTFHGPGQVILYPLLALNPAPAAASVALSGASSGRSPFRADLHWFLRSLESVVIRFLQLYGIQGERLEGASGVWVRDLAAAPSASSPPPSAASPPSPLRKIAAMGLSCSSWVSMHGLALNVDCDMRPFEYIVPCGLSDPSKFGGVTSMRQCLQREPIVKPLVLEHAQIRKQLLECFCEEFGMPKPAAIRTQPPTWQEQTQI